MSNIDKKILSEISRYKSINKYILEQDAPPADETALPVPEAPDAGATPPPPGLPPAGGEPAPGGEAQPVDIANDPDVEKIDNKGDSEETGGGDTEELDITDLVDAQKSSNEKQDTYFKDLFGHLERLESKLSEMDNLIGKINSLEAKIEKYRPKTAQEKLELRSLDSGPYNQKLTDFFTDKEPEMEKSGKNEYILTSDDVENFTPSDIRSSFTPEMPNKFGL